MWVVVQDETIIQKQLPFTIFECLEHKCFVIWKEKEAGWFTWSSEEVMDCLDVVKWGKGWKQKIRANSMFISNIFELLWHMFNNSIIAVLNESRIIDAHLSITINELINRDSVFNHILATIYGLILIFKYRA